VKPTKTGALLVILGTPVTEDNVIGSMSIHAGSKMLAFFAFQALLIEMVFLPLIKK
jgi:hypothetical protein